MGAGDGKMIIKLNPVETGLLESAGKIRLSPVHLEQIELLLNEYRNDRLWDVQSNATEEERKRIYLMLH